MSAKINDNSLMTFADLYYSSRYSVNVSSVAAMKKGAKNRLPSVETVVNLFREHEHGLIRGAFIRVTRRKVAKWLADNRLHLIYQHGSLVGAFVMAKITSRQTVKDFSGAVRTTFARGDLFVKRLACRSGGEHLIVSALRKGMQGRLWLRIWQEHRSDRTIASELKARWVCTKVLSGSELIGIWCAGHPSETKQVPRSENWTLRRLTMGRLRVGRARAALLTRSSDFITHYSAKYNTSKSWSAFSLRGYGADPRFIAKPSEMPKGWKTQNLEKLTWELRNTGARKALPQFEPLIRAIPGLKHRIRVMRLAAGGSIGRHSDVIDKEMGTARSKTLRIHIPISTNPGVRFTSWRLDGKKKTIHMRVGEAWYVDTRKPHKVENMGKTDRLHLVMDVVSCPKLLSALDGSAQDIK